MPAGVRAFAVETKKFYSSRTVQPEGMPLLLFLPLQFVPVAFLNVPYIATPLSQLSVQSWASMDVARHLT